METGTNWTRKLTSRKLWTAIVGIIVGLAAAFGLEENEWAQMAGVVGSIVSGIAYILAEAKVDAAAANPINLNFSEQKQETVEQKPPDAFPEGADINDLK